MSYEHIITKYWLCQQFGGVKPKKKWTTLSHNGVLFPPEYEPHGIPIVCNGKEIYLDKDAEEYATIYAKYTETEYIKNSIFRRNFWRDYKKILNKNNKDNKNNIDSLNNCDFSKIYDYILQQKAEMKDLSKEEKKRLKEKREKQEEKYKTAIVDGEEQQVGNYRIEPPGIFIGRGCHPKLGSIKKRLYPGDIVINIGGNAEVPKPLDGHEWQDVIHDQMVEWLASWKDPITWKTKYVWLGHKSKFKAESDKQKFDLAKKLKWKIKNIRKVNDFNLNSSSERLKQIATAVYFIDQLSLRVGNEKGEDAADTVGVTNLRVEHIKLLENNEITLDFLGKDSIRYVKTVEVPKQIYQNLKDFIIGKYIYDDMFDKINSIMINEYLQRFMKGLTAKVFRTYNATRLFEKELKKISKKYEDYDQENKINILLTEFNKANIKVAVLCNHQKKVPKSFTQQIEKINKQIKNEQVRLRKIKKVVKNEKKLKKIKDRIKKLKANKKLKLELKNISLETSKANYIDPRVTVKFMRKHNMPIDKIFSKNLQEKFWWAFEEKDTNKKNENQKA